MGGREGNWRIGLLEVRMARIAFIAPNRNLFDQGRQSLRELGLDCQVELYHAILKDGVAIARRVEAEGIDAIVSRAVRRK